MTALAFDFFEQRVWEHVPIEDPRAREVYDRHYSRREASKGEDGLVAPGRRFLLMHHGTPRVEDGVELSGLAIWAIVYGRWKAPGWTEGVWTFRNSIFRNESTTRSSDLIRAATAESYALFTRRYTKLPEVSLTTEIDIEATKDFRSQWHAAGWCYKKAGWTFSHVTPRGHGRSAKAIWKAPAP